MINVYSILIEAGILEENELIEPDKEISGLSFNEMKDLIAGSEILFMDKFVIYDNEPNELELILKQGTVYKSLRIGAHRLDDEHETYLAALYFWCFDLPQRYQDALNAYFQGSA